MKSIFLVFSLCILGTLQCPMGSQKMSNEDVCMYAISDARNYTDALHRCDVYGGTLAKIQNVYENSYIFGMLTSEFGDTLHQPYIGIIQNGMNNWTYSDGTPLTYMNWAPNEPMSGNCATMDPLSGKWHSASCDQKLPSFCSVNQTNLPCPSDWIYHAKTDSCYYYQGFTYPDGIHWQLYNWSITEKNCVKMGAHLVSIHSKEEDDFIYDLIYTNVASWLNVAPKNESCFFQYVWIGYYGKGDLGTGTWTDGTPVDYIGGDTIPDPFYWAIANDDSCKRKLWDNGPDEEISSRYVCKMAPMKKGTRTRGQR